jgi:competence protein ComEC
MTRSKTMWGYKEIGIWIGGVLVFCFIYRFVEKDSLMYIINRALPPREAGVMGGMLLGDRMGFDKDFYQYLKNSGLVHLVIVSGSNVMLLVGGLIESLAGIFGRKKIIIVGLILGWGYASMVGWEVPVVRAMLMLSILYWAQLLGRRYDVIRGLILAVLLMLIGDWQILTSVSFWLSIMAFLGVLTVKEVALFKNNFSHRRVCKGGFQIQKIIFETVKIILPTIWVSLWITPILALVFGKISIISPVTNLLVIGVVEVITLVGAIGTVAGLFVPVVGKIILWLVYPLLKYFSVVAEMGGSGWWSTVSISFNWWMLIGWYLVLFYFLMKRKLVQNEKV